jgi:ribulose-phosphate 3-epimerase
VPAPSKFVVSWAVPAQDATKFAPGCATSVVGVKNWIVPSVLPVDFARLGEEVAALEAAGADMIQWDVMDGQFVPNLTFGPDVIASARPHTTLPFEAHLMVMTPERMAEQYVKAGCGRLIIHAESTIHLHRVLQQVRGLGATAAVALNPSTPAAAVAHVLDLVDMVLVMTVNPGFGGQAYIATMEPKMREIRTMIGDRPIRLEIDGGVNATTISGAAAAGVDTFIAGSALFKHPDGVAAAITELRQLADEAAS